MKGTTTTTLSGKKIMLLVTQSKYGGAQKYILELARYFKEHNEVHIVVGNKHEQDPRFFAEARTLGIEPIILTKLIRDISLVKAVEATLEIRTLLQKEKPDLLHINSSMAGAVGSAAALLYRLDPLNRTLAVIYTVHGFVFNEPMSAMRKRFYVFIEQMSARWKGALICVSEFDKAAGLKNKIASDRKLVVVHNGVRQDLAFETKEQARSALTIPSIDSPIIGTIASLYKTKGLEYLIRAVAQLIPDFPKLRCIIIGDGPEKAALTEEVKKLNLGNHIFFTGALVDAPSLNRAFDIFVLTSVKEGLPTTILEAGVAELPVVATRVGGIPEIITNEHSGLLVDSQNPDLIAQAVKSLLANPDKAQRLARALHKKVQQDFTESAMLKETEAIYCQLLPQIAKKQS